MIIQGAEIPLLPLAQQTLNKIPRAVPFEILAGAIWKIFANHTPIFYPTLTVASETLEGVFLLNNSMNIY